MSHFNLTLSYDACFCERVTFWLFMLNNLVYFISTSIMLYKGSSVVRTEVLEKVAHCFTELSVNVSSVQK